MTQTALFKEDTFQSPAYLLAVRLIKAYVLRGDSIDSLKRGQGGMGVKEGSASISGYLDGKRYSTDKIVVELKDGTREVFDLKKVYNDIKESQYDR